MQGCMCMYVFMPRWSTYTYIYICTFDMPAVSVFVQKYILIYMCFFLLGGDLSDQSNTIFAGRGAGHDGPHPVVGIGMG